MECNEDGTCSYKPRPKPAAAVVPPTPVVPTPAVSTTTNSLGDALLAQPAPCKEGAEGAEDDEAVDQKGIIISLMVMCLSIPALIGACCWPALVIGLVSGTVSASARSLGHVISFWTTFFLMFVVFLVLGKEVFFVSGQRYHAPAKEKYGPLGVFFFAALLIMTDPSVHMMGDLGWWRWCGNNPQFDRINSTNSWPSQCAGSSTHYVCTIGCCVSTWQNTSNAKDTPYAWLPPSADFSPGGPIPGSFLTLRPDGTVYQAPGTTGPFQLFSATTQQPLVFYETGEVNPLNGGYMAAECPKYGVNPITGYCYMTDVTLPYEEQLAQLGEYGMALADPSQPFNMTTNNYVCGCDGCTPTEDFAHLSVVGVFSAIVCTYVGFTLLAVAVGWNANIHKKLKKFKEQWNKLRGLQKKRAAALSNAEYTAATLP